MRNVLQINTSLFSAGGQSSRFASQFATALLNENPGAGLTVRDLARDPVPHLDAVGFQAFLAKPEQRTQAQRESVEYSDALIAELRRADAIVIGLPMYNFGVPSTLKAYFDQVARAGETFRYTDKGPQGLLQGKRVYIFATRGGLYAGTPLDTQTGYVRDFLAFLGLSDVEFIYAEGLAISESSRQIGLGNAQQGIDRLLAPERQAA